MHNLVVTVRAAVALGVDMDTQQTVLVLTGAPSNDSTASTRWQSPVRRYQYLPTAVPGRYVQGASLFAPHVQGVLLRGRLPPPAVLAHKKITGN